MTTYLYGSDACTACKQAATILGKTWIDWAYVDVNTLHPLFDGEIPCLVLEDGRQLTGLGAINNYVNLFLAGQT